MGQLVKRHKIISIPWACPVFPLAIYTVALVGTNMEKCDMQFVTATFDPPYLWYNTVETVNVLKKGRPLVNTEASGGQHPKYHHRVLSGIIPGDGPFHHHQFIWS